MSGSLITGANGLLGSHMTSSLLANGQRVIAVKRRQSSLRWFYHIARFDWQLSDEQLGNLIWVEADLLEKGILERHLPHVESVYHCAGMVSFKPSDREALMRVNRDGTKHLLQIVRSVAPEVSFCHISSNSVLNGKGGSESDFGQWEQWEGSHYGYSKYMAELEVEKARNLGLRASIINPGVILGFSDPTRSSGRLMFRLYRGAYLWPPGSVAVTGVRDVCRAAQLLVECQLFEGRYLCVTEHLSYIQLFNLSMRLGRRKVRPVTVHPRIVNGAVMAAKAAWRLGIHLPFEPTILQSSLQHNEYSNARLSRVPFAFTETREVLEQANRAYDRLYAEIKKGG